MLNTDTKAREFKFDSIHYIKALFELMKPRVMSLAIFTCVVGFLIAPYKSVDYLYAILSITAVALGSGAAGSLNCWYEADIDKAIKKIEREMMSGSFTLKQEKEFMDKIKKLRHPILLPISPDRVHPAVLSLPLGGLGPRSAPLGIASWALPLHPRTSARF